MEINNTQFIVANYKLHSKNILYKILSAHNTKVAILLHVGKLNYYPIWLISAISIVMFRHLE